MLDELTACAPEAAGRRARLRRRIVACCTLCALILAATVTMIVRRSIPAPTVVERVDVNFITDPYEATVFLDNKQSFRYDGTPYITPCTIEDLPAKPHHVVLRHGERPELDAGWIDFAEAREIVIRFEPAP